MQGSVNICGTIMPVYQVQSALSALFIYNNIEKWYLLHHTNAPKTVWCIKNMVQWFRSLCAGSLSALGGDVLSPNRHQFTDAICL